jgi:hypothetical protein
MAEIKTKVNDASVEDFINAVKEEQKRKDSFTILKMMKQATKEEPKIVGHIHYRVWLCTCKKCCNRQRSRLVQIRLFSAESKPFIVPVRKYTVVCTASEKAGKAQDRRRMLIHS